MIEFTRWRENDYWTAGILLKPYGAMWVAWATQKGDPWVDEERNLTIQRIGFVHYSAESSVGRAIVFWRLKIGFMRRKKVIA